MAAARELPATRAYREFRRLATSPWFHAAVAERALHLQITFATLAKSTSPQQHLWAKMVGMSNPGLKELLQSDLTAAIKSRDTLRSATLRMALAAVTKEEVSGKAARTLSDVDVVNVLTREAKMRREAASAYDAAERPQLATRERDELEVIVSYLPQPLTGEEVAKIVADAIAKSGASGPTALGLVMKLVQPDVAGKAEGGVVAAEVRRQLQS